jgi:hypothetical protein
LWELTYLYTENSEDDEEGATDEYDIADRSKREEQCLDDEFQTWSTANHPVNIIKD